MEPPLLAMPNLTNAPQIFGSLYARNFYARAPLAGHGNLCGSIPRNNDYSFFNLADGVGFEPTDAFTSAVFKTAALGRSATRPVLSLLNLTSLLPFFLASYWVALAFGSASFGCSILSGWLPSHGAFWLLSGWCAGRVRLPRSS